MASTCKLAVTRLLFYFSSRKKRNRADVKPDGRAMRRARLCCLRMHAAETRVFHPRDGAEFSSRWDTLYRRDVVLGHDFLDLVVAVAGHVPKALGFRTFALDLSSPLFVGF